MTELVEVEKDPWKLSNPFKSQLEQVAQDLFLEYSQEW